MIARPDLHLAAIGAGGFGHFATQHFLQVPGVTLGAIAGTHHAQAQAMAKRFGVPDVEDVQALLALPDVDLVYIATPPFLHHTQSKAALLAGKHVICEKPLAVNVEQAKELVNLATERGLICSANLMQRYNPLYSQVQRLIQSQALGEVLHGYFENYATDEGLTPDHWFWDDSKSGGIFLEHGVHFFDMFEGWLGAGEVLSAHRTLREGSGVEEQVQCTVRYGAGQHVNFYHGFTQPSRLDRQEFRILFEHGDITLEEWVPIRGRIRALVNEEQTRTLMDLFPGARLDIPKSYGGKDRQVHGRHKRLDVSQQVELTFGFEVDKMTRYGELLRSLMEDQKQHIADPSHPRLLTETNALNSVIAAARATELSRAS